MSEPENQTLHILRDIRGALQSLDQKVDKNHTDLLERVDNLARIFAGETVLGRYAAAEVEERLGALERRVSALEDH